MPAWVWIVAAVTVVALITAGIVVARSGSSHSTASAGPSATTVAPHATTTSIDPSGRDITDPSTGIRVHVPKGAVIGNGTFTFGRMSAPTALGDALSPDGPVVDIQLHGARLAGAIDITLPVTDPSALQPVTLPDGTPAPGSTFVVAHWAHGATEPDLLVPALDANAHTVTIHTSSLSPFGLFHIATQFVIDLAKNFLEQLTGGLYTDVPQPACNGTDSSAAWTATPADDPVSWCANTDASGQHVQVANRRRYAVDVSVAPRGATIKGDTTDLAAQLSGLLNNTRTVTLAPGEVADIESPSSAHTATVTVEYDGLAQSLTALLVAIDIIAAIAAKVPFSGVKSAKDFLHLLDIAGCVKSLGIRIDTAVVNPAGTIAKLLVNCLKVVIEHAGGLLGVVLGGVIGLIGGTVAFFVSSGQALFDLIVGGANGTLAFDSSSLPTSTTTTTTSTGGSNSVWPTGDNEGPPALYTYIGAELYFPDWVSCSANYCIAGDGDQVKLYRLNGIDDLGSIPLSTADPRTTFINDGVPAADVDAFMKPGPP